MIDALDRALNKINLRRDQLGTILLNEATPVIGDVAMETITETIITESAMIGHNPSTPGGRGLGMGITMDLADLPHASLEQSLIVIVPQEVEFRTAAAQLNAAMERGLSRGTGPASLSTATLPKSLGSRCSSKNCTEPSSWRR